MTQKQINFDQTVSDYLRAMRELALDVGEPEETPRPPEIRGRANLRSED